MTTSAPAAHSAAPGRQVQTAAQAETTISRLRREHGRVNVRAIAERAVFTAFPCQDSDTRARMTDAVAGSHGHHDAEEQRHDLLEAAGREQKAGQEPRRTRHDLEQRPKTARCDLRCAGERITGLEAELLRARLPLDCAA
ncbi:hypothetical protein ACWD1Y_45195 [Streptomyces sp. NPDC002814]